MLQMIFSRMACFGIAWAPSKEAGRERLRAHRLYTNLPVEYRVIFDGQESQLASRAKLKNISHGGAYLECDQHPQLDKGQVGHFTFSSQASKEESGAIHLAAKAIVRRLDRHLIFRGRAGVPFRSFDLLPREKLRR